MGRSARWVSPVLPFALSLLALSTAADVAAQTLKGRILDGTSREPVMLAYVGLLAEGGDMVVAALASRDGEFTLEAPRPGSYFVYVARTGYETLMDGIYDLGSGGVFEVQIGLKPAPIEIDPVLVEGDRDMSPLEAEGFYQRATMGRGHFLIREEIALVAIEKITDALRGLSNVNIDASRPLIGSPEIFRNPAIYFRRGLEQCSPALYIDRAMVATGVSQPVRPDDYIHPADVEAMEVYTRPSQVPVDFRATGDCGVVLIWTTQR